MVYYTTSIAMKIGKRHFILYIALFLCALFMTRPASAIQGQLNYNIGQVEPTIPIPTPDSLSLAKCLSKIDSLTQTSLEVEQQKTKCQETNALLNKTMKESVDQNVQLKRQFTLTLIVVSAIACFFFISTVFLLLTTKKNPPSPIQDTNLVS